MKAKEPVGRGFKSRRAHLRNKFLKNYNMEIRLGPAGIPTVCESRNTLDALKVIKEIGLNSMEVEFVRNIYLNKKSAKEVGELANELDIKLSIHAPYFINLLSDKKDVVKKSKERILTCLEIGEVLNAEFIAIHAAYYGKLTNIEAYRKMKEITLELIDRVNEMGIKNSKIAYETMAKTSQFADLDTLIKLYEEVNSKLLSICIDFGHIFVRNNGSINYSEIFDKIEKAKIKYLHTHFEGVKYNLKTKKFVDVHEPIDRNPPFKPLAEEIFKRKIDITIISESPVLEKDSLKMKKIFEELGYKF